MSTALSQASRSRLCESALAHLAALVAHDTRNPPRRIDREGIIAYIAAELGKRFTVEVRDHGAGSLSLFAQRGRPRVLFNFHLDTVPDAPGWSRDPFRLHVEDGRAYGLGACDVKGAAAAMLAACELASGDAALLFTTDEEANDARAVAAFLEEGPRFELAVVAEPTGCRAVLAHRGIASVDLRFRGRAGHASRASGRRESAIHRAVQWSARALALADALDEATFAGLSGFRFNIGRIEGGIKANVVAPETYIRFGFRPLPGQSLEALLQSFRSLASEEELASFVPSFIGPPLPADPAHAAAQLAQARAAAEELGLPIGDAVDFWTEAALFSQAGWPAFVFGPGEIAQAHTADEWVAIEQLETAAGHYLRILKG